MLISMIRTAMLYGLLIFSVRLMGKRQVAEMEPAEFVVTMLLANLAAVPMQDNGLPLLSGVVPILTVLALELLLAVGSMKLLPLRRLLNGVPTLLIRDGRIDQRALAAARVSLDELEQKLRERTSSTAPRWPSPSWRPTGSSRSCSGPRTSPPKRPTSEPTSPLPGYIIM